MQHAMYVALGRALQLLLPFLFVYSQESNGAPLHAPAQGPHAAAYT